VFGALVMHDLIYNAAALTGNKDTALKASKGLESRAAAKQP